MHKLKIVRWLPLAMMVAACSTESATAPDQVDESLLVSALAQSGSGNGRWTNGNANLGTFSVSEQRLWHARYYLNEQDPSQPGNYRVCYLNPVENSDGSNWRNGEDRGGHLHINEPDAFVMIKERPATASDLWTVNGVTLPRPVAGYYGEPFHVIPPIPLNETSSGVSKWTVTYIGRAKWTSNGFLYPSGKELSRHSMARGVVAPVPEAWNSLQSGLWSDDNGHDLKNTGLAPNDPWYQGIEQLLADTYATPEARGALRYVECDVDFYWMVLHNEIVTSPEIPNGLLSLVPGAK